MMALKQTSFNFDFPEEESIQPAKPLLQKPVNIVEEEAEPIEVFIEEKVVVAEAPKKQTRGRLKLSEMSNADQPEVPDDKTLFEKKYYSIGIVSEMFKVKQSVIRYWENEFDILKPKKNGKGDRLFRPEDIQALKMIFHLLRERKYTIEGAKDFLKKNKKAEEKFAMIESLKKLRSFLYEMKANL